MTSAVLIGGLGREALVLAQQQDNGGQGEDFGKSSPVGFLVLILFLIAVAFLVRSMTKHLKRVPATFDPEEAAEMERAAAEAEAQSKIESESGGETAEKTDSAAAEDGSRTGK
jgi:Na+-transporting methylmalonyl-CoA/oxaloacetate decarboxylase gamma subunit